MVFNTTFKKYFSYVVAVSFTGGDEPELPSENRRPVVCGNLAKTCTM